jgi:hypothetical protein
MPKPGEPAMIITLDIEGNFISATYADGKKRADNTPIPKENIKEAKMTAYSVHTYQTSTKKCVTYQTPHGPVTV